MVSERWFQAFGGPKPKFPIDRFLKHNVGTDSSNSYHTLVNFFTSDRGKLIKFCLNII